MRRSISNYLFPGAITRTFEIPYHRLALPPSAVNWAETQDDDFDAGAQAVTVFLHPPLTVAKLKVVTY